MPTVKDRSSNRRDKKPQSGYQTRDQIKKTHLEDLPRDDVREAFAGSENQAAMKDPTATQLHSTSVRARKTKKSRERTPVR